MAVTTVGQTIYSGALAKSSKNQSKGFGTAEIIGRINRRLQGLYQVASLVNPNFFAETADVVEAAGVWARPEEAQTVVRVDNATPVEVAVVPYDDRQAEPSMFSVYEWGQEFNAITNATGTTSGNLTFWYSRRPTDVTNLTPDTLDPQWREDYNELLILELAIDISAKDGRVSEVAALKADRNEWLQRFVAFLRNTTANERRRFGHRRNITINELIPLLAGG